MTRVEGLEEVKLALKLVQGQVGQFKQMMGVRTKHNASVNWEFLAANFNDL